MNKFICILTLFFFSIHSIDLIAQHRDSVRYEHHTCITTFDSLAGKEIYLITDPMPEFPGGIQKMKYFIDENIPWTKEGDPITGIVFISCIVEADGTLTNVRVKKGITEGTDREALYVIKQMPKWIPGKCEDKKVPVLISIPVKFGLH